MECNDADGEVGRPDQLNGLAVFLASEASGFVTGANILADVSAFSLERSGGRELMIRIGWVRCLSRAGGMCRHDCCFAVALVAERRWYGLSGQQTRSVAVRCH